MQTLIVAPSIFIFSKRNQLSKSGMLTNLTLNVQNSLGEGPIFHKKRNSVIWIDINKNEILEYKLADSEIVNYKLHSKPGTIALDAKGNLLVALQGEIVILNFETQAIIKICALEKKIPTNRPNDGKIGPDGNLWLGTMNLDCKKGEGAFYCIDKKGNAKKILSKLSIPNGMAWDKTGRLFYHIDSPNYNVKSYLFNSEKSEIIFHKIVLQFSEINGMPDGMAIDAEGMLWIAFWGGFSVQRWNPQTGHLLETILLPAPQITSCTFFGPNLNYLFITSARTGLSDSELNLYPESGNVFIRKMNARGYEPNIFGEKSY